MSGEPLPVGPIPQTACDEATCQQNSMSCIVIGNVTGCWLLEGSIAKAWICLMVYILHFALTYSDLLRLCGF